MHKEEYRGWLIVAHHQFELRPFLPFVAVPRRVVGGTLFGFNKEGWTLAEAVHRAKQEIDRRSA